MILEWKVENTLKSEHSSHFFIRYLTTLPQNAHSYLMSIFFPSSFPPVIFLFSLVLLLPHTETAGCAVSSDSLG